MQEGDLLLTSGVDGVYPAGLQVARIKHIERRADSTFARIYCTPLAQMDGARQVMVLQPVGDKTPEAAKSSEPISAAPKTPPKPVPKANARREKEARP